MANMPLFYANKGDAPQKIHPLLRLCNSSVLLEEIGGRYLPGTGFTIGNGIPGIFSGTNNLNITSFAKSKVIVGSNLQVTEESSTETYVGADVG